MSIAGGSGPSGPGGIAGGPTGVDGIDEVDELADVQKSSASSSASAATGVAGNDPLAALAADLSAGKISPHQALERLIDSTMHEGLSAADRSDLRAMITDLADNDPYLKSLLGQLSNR